MYCLVSDFSDPQQCLRNAICTVECSCGSSVFIVVECAVGENTLSIDQFCC